MNKLQNLVKILEQDIYATKDIDNDWFVESAIKSLNNLKAAISVTQCCEELKYKEVIPFEEWLSHFKKEDNRYWLNKHTQYCKEAMKMHYNTLPNE
tara:strand:+ start:659 stop:946 length:288 start_codon:yes stop_codon:yes gene_type:complete